MRTTPEATDLQGLFAVMRERGVTAVAMEVSSHALTLGRVDGVVYDAAAFTNLTQDHLDFHRDMAEYEAAKASLFTPRRARHGVVNLDDAAGRRLAARGEIPTWGYGDGGDWQVSDLESGPSGSTLPPARAGRRPARPRAAAGRLQRPQRGGRDRHARGRGRRPAGGGRRRRAGCPACPGGWSGSTRASPSSRSSTSPTPRTPSRRCCGPCAPSPPAACSSCSAAAATATGASAR